LKSSASFQQLTLPETTPPQAPVAFLDAFSSHFEYPSWVGQLVTSQEVSPHDTCATKCTLISEDFCIFLRLRFTQGFFNSLQLRGGRKACLRSSFFLIFHIFFVQFSCEAAQGALARRDAAHAVAVLEVRL